MKGDINYKLLIGVIILLVMLASGLVAGPDSFLGVLVILILSPFAMIIDEGVFFAGSLFALIVVQIYLRKYLSSKWKYLCWGYVGFVVFASFIVNRRAIMTHIEG